MSDTVIDKSRLDYLEKQVMILSEEKEVALDALNRAVSLGQFETTLSGLSDVEPILHDIGQRVSGLLAFTRMGVYLVNEETSDFTLSYMAPDHELDRSILEEEVQALIEDRIVALALEGREPVFAATEDGEDILLHGIATASRTRGLFVGVMAYPKSELYETVLRLVTIVMRHGAHMLESFELYRHLKRSNEWLEEQVAQRTHALEEKNHELEREIQVRAEAEEKLRAAEADFRSIFENAVEGIFRSMPDGCYTQANPALAEIYGYGSAQELLTSVCSIQKQVYVDSGRRKQFIDRIKKRGFIRNFESQVFRRDGGVIWISENARAIYDDDGNLAYFEGTVIDITERKQMEDELQFLATTDSLTGLYNRRHFMEASRKEVSRSKRYGHDICLLMIDADFFKSINDAHGHQAGDQVLKELAQVIENGLRDVDILGRMGGEEFAVVLPETHLEAARLAAERLRLLVETSNVLSSITNISITISVGVSELGEHAGNLDSLIRNADTALYEAKRKGRNRVELYHPDLPSS